VGQVLSPSVAFGWSPRSFPEKMMREGLARSLGVEVELVVDARGYDLARSSPMVGFALGRYRSRGSKAGFPALFPYWTCKDGLCEGRALRLGGNASRLRPLGLIDLDAPKTTVSADAGSWYSLDCPEPGKRAAWPVLVVLVEREAGGAHGPSQQESVLLISVREAAAPKILLDLETLVRYPEGPGPGGRGLRENAIVGHRIGGMILSRRGERREIVVEQSPIESRGYRCLRPPSTTRRFEMKRGTFMETKAPPAKDPHPSCR
jgi:hypothetical protein